MIQGASAETLQEALAAAYTNNPTLNAQRARLRATDEGVPEALSGFRPSLTVSGDVGVRKIDTEPKVISTLPSDGTLHPKGYDITLNQSLFSGFGTINAVREAEANVRAGRESLRSVERSTLLDAVTAYMNVVRDQAVVRLRENNLKVLSEQLTATKYRLKFGRVTKTDVAQAEARRAQALSQLSAAQANLRASRAVYEQVIGHSPSFVSHPPPVETGLPSTLPEALGIGEVENPDILTAHYLADASRYEIKKIISETLPSFSVEAQFQERFDPSLARRELKEVTVIGRLTIPLYRGGEPSARARAARDTNYQRRREIDAARDKTRSDIVSAWSRLTSARAQIESNEAQVRASDIALKGVRKEEKVGQRTILDILDAEQELLDAQVELIGTKRDLVVAAFTLSAAIGRLDVANLGLPVAYYNPTEHYDRVRRKLFGFGRQRGFRDR